MITIHFRSASTDFLNYTTFIILKKYFNPDLLGVLSIPISSTGHVFFRLLKTKVHMDSKEIPFCFNSFGIIDVSMFFNELTHCKVSNLSTTESPELL